MDKGLSRVFSRCNVSALGYGVFGTSMTHNVCGTFPYFRLKLLNKPTQLVCTGLEKH